jgi:RNA polymerase sigma-70 factor (ECF subfamily)
MAPMTSFFSKPAARRSSEAEPTLDDVDLFGQLVEAHRDKLYRVAYRMAGDVDDAQDLLQDALVEAYRAFRKFQRGSHFDKWLYRIMTNTFIDRQRRRKRAGVRLSLDSPADEGEEAQARDLPDPDSDPSDILMRETLAEPIQRALDSLPAEFRMVLILADVEEFSYEEIGQMMGTPVGTVRSRLHRARSMARKCITGDTGPE